MKHRYLSFLQACGRKAGFSFQEVIPGILYIARYEEASFPMKRINLGLNHGNAELVQRSKYTSYRLWSDASLPVIPHTLLHNPGRHTDDSYVERPAVSPYEAATLFLSSNETAVLKPDEGGKGEGVTLVTDQSTITPCLNAIFQTGKHAVLNPYQASDYEYRAVVLDGEMRMVFRKEKRPGFWKHNLTGGGAVAFLEEDHQLLGEIQALALPASQTLGLRFAAIDVLATSSGLKLLEANSMFSLEKSLRGDSKAKALAETMFIDAFCKKRDTLRREGMNL